MLTQYLNELNHLFRGMKISNASGACLSTDDGAHAAIALIEETKRRNGKAMVVGNGGSAAIASHTQNDFCKAVGMRSLVFTEPPLLTALSNDDSYQSAYESLIRLWAVKGDLLVAISSSGCSENILRSVKAAKDAECKVITMTGFRADNPLRRTGDVNFYIPSADYGPVEITHAALAQFLTDAVKIK
jgi:D-sedoheptulose 7-phosphate isomerase